MNSIYNNYYNYFDNNDIYSTKYIQLTNVINIGCILSIFFSVISVILYLLFKENRNFNINIIISTSILNVLYSIGMLLPLKSNISMTCKFQSFIVNFSQLSQYLSILFLSIINFISLIKKNLNSKKAFLIYLSFITVIPFFFSYYVIYTKSYGDSGGYCCIDYYNVYKRLFIKKLTFNKFLLMLFVLVINIFFIAKVFVMIYYNKKIENKNIYFHINLYSVLMIISIIPEIYLRLDEVINKQNENANIKRIEIFFENFVGVLYNILFIFSPWNRQNILNCINTIKYKNKNMLENIENSILLNENLNKSLSEILNEKDEYDIDEESDDENNEDNKDNDNNENKINEINNNNNDLNEFNEYKNRKYKKKNKKKKNRLTKEMIEYFYGNEYYEEIEDDINE